MAIFKASDGSEWELSGGQSYYAPQGKEAGWYQSQGGHQVAKPGEPTRMNDDRPSQGYLVDHAHRIKAYYRAYLHRDPSEEEIHHWLKQDMPAEAIEDAIINSPESVGSDITKLYQEILGRTPSQDEIGYWSSRGQGGTAGIEELRRTLTEHKKGADEQQAKVAQQQGFESAQAGYQADLGGLTNKLGGLYDTTESKLEGLEKDIGSTYGGLISDTRANYDSYRQALGQAENPWGETYRGLARGAAMRGYGQAQAQSRAGLAARGLMGSGLEAAQAGAVAGGFAQRQADTDVQFLQNRSGWQQQQTKQLADLYRQHQGDITGMQQARLGGLKDLNQIRTDGLTKIQALRGQLTEAASQIAQKVEELKSQNRFEEARIELEKGRQRIQERQVELQGAELQLKKDLAIYEQSKEQGTAQWGAVGRYGGAALLGTGAILAATNPATAGFAPALGSAALGVLTQQPVSVDKDAFKGLFKTQSVYGPPVVEGGSYPPPQGQSAFSRSPMYNPGSRQGLRSPFDTSSNSLTRNELRFPSPNSQMTPGLYNSMGLARSFARGGF